MKKVTVSQSGTGSSAGHRAGQVSWFQCCVQSTSTTSTIEVRELNGHKHADRKQQLCPHVWSPYISTVSQAVVLTLSLCPDPLQGKPTASVMHLGAGSKCPASTAHGPTTPSAPHTWPPTTGAKRRYVCLSTCVHRRCEFLQLVECSVFVDAYELGTFSAAICWCGITVILFLFCFRRCSRGSISCTLSATPFHWHRWRWQCPSSAISSKKQKTSVIFNWKRWKSIFFILMPRHIPFSVSHTHKFQASALHAQLHPHSPLHLLHMSSSQHLREGRSALHHIWWQQRWAWVHGTEAPYGKKYVS